MSEPRESFYRLASYAAFPEKSRGRVYSENFKDKRPAYERDRDRVIHSGAFRRLEYKTQVFVFHEGDYYRTRLTHSLEVAQIARGIAKKLMLNVDLAETLALSHDLGHTPFGHAGETTLNRLTKDHGGFEHNIQSLRIVTLLEDRYPDFPGLNLTWETREGLIKHHSAHDSPKVPAEYEPDIVPPLEAQLIDIADEIAYNNHDLDDGIKSELLDLDELQQVAVWRMIETKTKKRLPRIDHRHLILRTISSLIGFFIQDVINTTLKNIKEFYIETLEDVRALKHRIADHSEEVKELRDELRKFLFDNLYRQPHLERMRFKADHIITVLFETYLENPVLMPAKYREMTKEHELHRVIADYIAGMTDRFALEEYRRLFDPYAL